MIKTRFIKKIVKEIRNENLAIFAGAGLSIPAGLISWKTLAKPFAEELNLDIEKESDLVSLMQYYANEKNGRHEISEAIFNNFSPSGESTENHKILARLPIKTYWTTNYDSLIEDALKAEGKIVDIKSNEKQLTMTKNKRDTILYKMHGDKENPTEAIILKDEYESYFQNHSQFINTLKGDLISKTFIFIGFSFTDPNLEYILSRIRVAYEKNQRRHYCFLKKTTGNSYDTLKQEYFIKDLKRFGIEALLVNEYDEITEILKKIEVELNKDNIFISGSAANYSPFNEDDAKNIISNLSGEIIAQDYNIITGFGLGVGSFVISGALNQIYMKNKKIENNRIIMRPFPQETKAGEHVELWQRYREDMISRAGTVIVLFGNKTSEEGKIIDANGVYSEYKIAEKLGKNIVPVGITGSVTNRIWNEINEKFDEFYPNSTENMKNIFNRLNATTKQEDLINNIFDFIKEMKN